MAAGVRVVAPAVCALMWAPDPRNESSALTTARMEP